MNEVPRPAKVLPNRFILPNDIWEKSLSPKELAVLILLHSKYGVAVPPIVAERLGMSLAVATKCVASLREKNLPPDGLLHYGRFRGWDNYFSMPDEVFLFKLPAHALVIYAYLLYCEDRRTHQCHPSYRTIAEATGMSVNTVVKYVDLLYQKQFITIWRTTYLDKRCMKWNGNNLYTILPIRIALEQFYAQQMEQLRLDLAAKNAEDRLAATAV